MVLGRAELEKRFGFIDSGANHSDLRETFVDFAEVLDNMLGDSRAKDLALTHLEDASMWAHKALAGDTVGDEG